MRWVLRHGELPGAWADAPRPDLILYDPFSFKVDAPLWQPSTFRGLRALLGDHPAALYTYSNATAVRAALLAAGFFVGAGVPTGPKAETTVAWTHAERARPLGPAFLTKWRRSSAAFPPEILSHERDAFAALIEQHPQWSLADATPLIGVPPPV